MSKEKGGKIGFVENVVIETRDKYSGEVIQREELKNLIVNTGLELVAKLICKDETAGFDYIAIGTDNTAAQVTDTGLISEYTRAQADSSGSRYEADYKAVFEYTFTFGSGVSETITEAAVSDSSSASGEVILNRFVFTGKSVDSDTDLYIKVTITVSTS